MKRKVRQFQWTYNGVTLRGSTKLPVQLGQVLMDEGIRKVRWVNENIILVWLRKDNLRCRCVRFYDYPYPRWSVVECVPPGRGG